MQKFLINFLHEVVGMVPSPAPHSPPLGDHFSFSFALQACVCRHFLQYHQVQSRRCFWQKASDHCQVEGEGTCLVTVIRKTLNNELWMFSMLRSAGYFKRTWVILKINFKKPRGIYSSSFQRSRYNFMSLLYYKFHQCADLIIKKYERVNSPHTLGCQCCDIVCRTE